MSGAAGQRSGLPDGGQAAIAARSDPLPVFLSYSRADTEWAERVRARFVEAGIPSFLDRYGLPAGQAWLPQLEAEIARAGAIVVLCGRQGFGNWQRREVSLALDRQAGSAAAPVIPVLLPGLEDPPIGTFLSLNTWIDLRRDPDDASAWATLLAGVQGLPLGGASPASAALCPYRGLMAFREQDAGLFFGRERDVAALVARVTGRSASNVVCVTGRSGSGKSSVVFAGLVPVLRRARGQGGSSVWDVVDLTPGAEPLQALARAFDPPPPGLGAVAAVGHLNEAAAMLRDGRVGLGQLVRARLDRPEERGTDRLLLVVDQWEELYTLAEADGSAGAAAEVARFIELLLEAGRSAPVTVVLTLRADFFDRVLEHAGLKAALEGGLVPLGPMSRADLVEAIERPARAVGSSLQKRLTELLLDDLGVPPEDAQGAVPYDPGRLPLLEFALERSWRNARAAGRTTVLAQDYIDAGRLEGALEAVADEQYAKLSPEAQDAARRLMVSLVSPGQQRVDARARASVPVDPATREALRAFTSREARLVTTDADPLRPGSAYAEVTHEALIRHWGRLRGWVEASRQTLRRRDQVAAARERWLENGEDDAYLLPRGIQLEVGRALLADPGEVLIDDLVPFVRRSIEAAKRTRMAEQRRLRRWTAGLAAAAVLASISAAAAGVFFWDARDQARIAKTEMHRAEEQTWRALIAMARQKLREGDAGTALLLGLRAVPGDAVREQRDAVLLDRAADVLWNGLSSLRELRTIEAHEGGVNDVAFVPDADLLASVGEDGWLRLWRLSGEAVAGWRGTGGAIDAVTAVPGRGLATAALDGTVWLHEAADPSRARIVGRHGARVHDVASMPDGALVASAGEDGLVRLWRLDAAGDTVDAAGRLEGHVGSVWSVRFSRDGSKLVTTGEDGTLRVWMREGMRLAATLEGHDGKVAEADFDSLGEGVVSGGWDGTVRLWPSYEDPSHRVLSGHDGWVNSAHFADGGRIVSTGQDGTIRIWDRDGNADPMVLSGHRGEVWDVLAGPDGRTLLSAGADGTIRLWQVGPVSEPRISDAGASITSLRFSPDGTLLIGGLADGSVLAWPAVGGDPIRLGAHLDGSAVEGLSVAPDGRTVATGGQDGVVRIWPLVVGAPAASHDEHDGRVHDVVHLPSGALLSAGEDGTIRRRDPDGSLRVVVRHERPVVALAASADGRLLAWGDSGGLVQLLDFTAAEGGVRELGRYAPPVRAIGFSADGLTMMVAGGRGQIQHEPLDGSPGRDLRGHLGDVTDALFGPFGERIVSAGADGTIRIWRMDGGGEPLVQRAHHGPALAVAIAPDGTRLASGGRDRKLVVWTIGRGVPGLVERVCEAAPRDFTEDDLALFGLGASPGRHCAERLGRLWPHAARATVAR